MQHSFRLLLGIAAPVVPPTACSSLSCHANIEPVVGRYAPKPQFSTPQGQYTAFLEALLVGHEDWVHSVQWQGSSGQGLQAQPLCLLSTSMDRTMMLWRPDPATGLLHSSTMPTFVAWLQCIMHYCIIHCWFLCSICCVFVLQRPYTLQYVLYSHMLLASWHTKCGCAIKMVACCNACTVTRSQTACVSMHGH